MLRSKQFLQTVASASEVMTVWRYKIRLLSDNARLVSDVCLSRTSGLSREQRGLWRLKLA